MRRIRVNGLLFAAPFEHLFHALGQEERQTLVDGITLHGVLDPVHTYTSELHGRAILDGLNRAGIAEALGLDEIPARDHGRITDEDAEARAKSLNADRRILTVEEVARHAAERAAGRRDRVAAAREGGKSLRAIAADEGVSHEQVRRDAARSVTGGDRPGDTPEKLLERARRTLDRLIEGAVQLAESELSADLMSLAIAHGVPLRREGGACVWPVLSDVRAALADLAARAACG